jgi:hypothetical protein
VSDGPSTLARWSQRKLAARRGEVAPAEPEDDHREREATLEPQESAVATTGVAGGAEEPNEHNQHPPLPPIEELTAQSDYTAYLARGVPEALTRAALRTLWRSDPVLANLDGLNNYDEDYNVVDQAITAAQTSYRPGLGYFEEIETKLAQIDESAAQASSGEPAQSRAASAISDDDSAKLGPSDTAGDTPADESLDAPQHPGADENREAAAKTSPTWNK